MDRERCVSCLASVTYSIAVPMGYSSRRPGAALRYVCTVQPLPRPYADPVEIITAPVPAQSPFIPLDAKIVVGVVAPASPDPIPIVLLPGFEYRMSEWRHPETHDVHWRLERRKAAQFGEDAHSASRTPRPAEKVARRG